MQVGGVAERPVDTKLITLARVHARAGRMSVKVIATAIKQGFSKTGTVIVSRHFKTQQIFF